MKIHLKENVTPYAIHTARPIPYLWREDVKQTLDEMVSNGIIRAVDDEPTEWCHLMVIVPKTKGVRICVDLKKLNEQIKRPVHPLTSPRETVNGIHSEAKYFTSLDATQGYW